MIVGLVAVVVVVATVILWSFFGDALSNRSHSAAVRCVGGKEAVAVIADPSIADSVQQFAQSFNSTAGPVGDHCMVIGVKPAGSDAVLNGFIGKWPADLGGQPALWIPGSSISAARLAEERADAMDYYLGDMREDMPAQGVRFVPPGHMLEAAWGEARADIRRASQWIWPSPADHRGRDDDEPEHQHRQPERGRDGAEEIERVPLILGATLREEARRQRGGGDADRHVDKQNPAPAQAAGQDAAEKDASSAAGARYRAPDPKRAVALSSWRHREQIRASLVPHCSQKLAPSAFSNPQSAQRISPLDFACSLTD